MLKLVRLSLLVLILLLASLILAVPGDLDEDFGGGDGYVSTGEYSSVITKNFGSNNDLVIDGSGRIIVVGTVGTSPNTDLGLARFLENGTLDTSFGGTGFVSLSPGMTDDAYAVALDAQGRIVVAGSTSDGTNYDMVVARYLATGLPDATFGGGDGFAIINFGAAPGDSETVSDVAIDASGNIYVAGSSNCLLAVLRLLPDGIPDNAFDTDGKATVDSPVGCDSAGAIVLQSDGKPVLAGSSSVDIGVGQVLVARLNTNGSPDTGFDADGYINSDLDANQMDLATAVALDASGNIVIAGYVIPGTISPTGFVVARYSSAGVLDSSFDGDGFVITGLGATNDDGYGVDVLIDPAGKIIVGGSDAAFFFSGNLALLRYTAGGSLDTTFDSDGILILDLGTGGESASGITLDARGDLVVVGYTSTEPVGLLLARFEGDTLPTDTEILYNISFEDGDGKFLETWTIKDATAEPKYARRKCNEDGKVYARTGECAVLMKGVVGVKSTVSQKFDLPTTIGSTFTLEAWVRGKKLTTGARILVKVKYADDTTLKTRFEDAALNAGTYEYKNLTVTDTFSKTVTSVSVALTMKNGAGKLFIDDLSLTVAPPAALLPLPR
jgi:uncharacterized delta-60 repeat protein